METEWSVSLDGERGWPVEVMGFLEGLIGAGAIGPVVTGDQVNPGRFGAQFNVLAKDPAAAVQRALNIVGSVLGDTNILSAEVLTLDELEHRLNRPTLPQLAGAQELAQKLGVSRQRFYELMKRKDFPKPVVDLAAGPVWLAESVNHFMENWERKPGRPRKAGPPKPSAKELMTALKASVETGKLEVEHRVAKRRQTGEARRAS